MFRFVFNMEMGIRLSLDYSYEEFKNKVNLDIFKGSDIKNKSNCDTKDENNSSLLPFIFGSECPGWTCYAEKKEGDFVIPYMSLIKSPQQIQGNIIKNMISSLFKIDINVINHISIMPCYDKKLEAARDPYSNIKY